MARYGYCPICGAEGVKRERRMNGYTECSAGHRYLSKLSLNSPPLPKPELRLARIAMRDGTLSAVKWFVSKDGKWYPLDGAFRAVPVPEESLEAVIAPTL